MSPKPIARYECAYRAARGAGVPHTEGTGRPKRKACVCGSTTWTHLVGWWGVFVHSSYPNAGPSGGHYHVEDAVQLYSSEVTANLRVTEDRTGSLVVRWVNA